MGNAHTYRQAGMTLIEVMVSVLILAIGLLGAAAIQLNALRYTDSARMTSQASFVAYDMMDRIRANVDGNNGVAAGAGVLAGYALAGLAAAPPENLNNAVAQDLADFATNIRNFAGTTGENSRIQIARPPANIANEVTITIVWDDSRAAAANDLRTGATGANNLQTFELSSRIGVNTVVTP
jgi:type IV pilus assembly protein PilV